MASINTSSLSMEEPSTMATGLDIPQRCNTKYSSCKGMVWNWKTGQEVSFTTPEVWFLPHQTACRKIVAIVPGTGTIRIVKPSLECPNHVESQYTVFTSAHFGTARNDKYLSAVHRMNTWGSEAPINELRTVRLININVKPPKMVWNSRNLTPVDSEIVSLALNETVAAVFWEVHDSRERIRRLREQMGYPEDVDLNHTPTENHQSGIILLNIFDGVVVAVIDGQQKALNNMRVSWKLLLSDKLLILTDKASVAVLDLDVILMAETESKGDTANLEDAVIWTGSRDDDRIAGWHVSPCDGGLIAGLKDGRMARIVIVGGQRGQASVYRISPKQRVGSSTVMWIISHDRKVDRLVWRQF
ncbi:hypothetical protein HDU76_008126 [Blyttiomyces sp. JEL0837]|nr:hypothetical protein HDU76_008126 [Blyttiomyces sp. JEL0837]